MRATRAYRNGCHVRGVPIGVPPGECSATLRSVGGVLGTIARMSGRPPWSFLGGSSALPPSSTRGLFETGLRKLPAPHTDFSDLYQKMSGRGESAVLSPPAARIAAIKSVLPSISAGVFETGGTLSEVGVLCTAGAEPAG